MGNEKSNGAAGSGKMQARQPPCWRDQAASSTDSDQPTGLLLRSEGSWWCSSDRPTFPRCGSPATKVILRGSSDLRYRSHVVRYSDERPESASGTTGATADIPAAVQSRRDGPQHNQMNHPSCGCCGLGTAADIDPAASPQIARWKGEDAVAPVPSNARSQIGAFAGGHCSSC